MSLTDYDFELPEAHIALRPAEPRDTARLMHVHGRSAVGGLKIDDLIVRDLPGLLHSGDVLVFNDTRVIPARLSGKRTRDGSEVAVEATLHKRVDERCWTAFMKPGKRLKPGDLVVFGQDLTAHIVEKLEGGEVLLDFDLGGPALDAAIRETGVMPLPPYIALKRAEDERDRLDYQTVYARHDGSVAAPTAGLHFTPQLLEALDRAGIGQAFVTLHVGAGTFLPVKADRIEDHKMHSEFGVVSQQTADQLNAARAAGGRIISVGTTSARLLESATSEDGVVRPFAAPTDIFIRPGYRFRAIDGLMTNFHLPHSTLLMLLAAFAGLDEMKTAYAHALQTGYRFYSYGDSSLWWRKEPS
jgi:S-adenosylmethionine:tRNA ribosyltransferase-isomerase